jgi:hypothetical protein
VRKDDRTAFPGCFFDDYRWCFSLNVCRFPTYIYISFLNSAGAIICIYIYSKYRCFDSCHFPSTPKCLDKNCSLLFWSFLIYIFWSCSHDEPSGGPWQRFHFGQLQQHVVPLQLSWIKERFWVEWNCWVDEFSWHFIGFHAILWWMFNGFYMGFMVNLWNSWVINLSLCVDLWRIDGLTLWWVWIPMRLGAEYLTLFDQ